MADLAWKRVGPVSPCGECLAMASTLSPHPKHCWHW